MTSSSLRQRPALRSNASSSSTITTSTTNGIYLKGEQPATTQAPRLPSSPQSTDTVSSSHRPTLLSSFSSVSFASIPSWLFEPAGQSTDTTTVEKHSDTYSDPAKEIESDYEDDDDTLFGAFLELESNLLEEFAAFESKEAIAAKWRSVEHQISETWDRSQAKAVYEGARRLLTFEELPLEWQSNPYILKGYRFLPSKRQCLWSVFSIHNETCNIWTHLLGLFFIIGLAVHIHFSVLQDPSTTTTLYDHLVFSLFFLAAIKCLVSSTLYHTFLCHSQLPVMQCAAMLDYIGIGILITASVMATLHYGFYCHTRLLERTLFLSASFLMGLVGCLLPLYSFFDRPSFRVFRVMIFVGMACSGVLPMFYMVYLHGLEKTLAFMFPLMKSGLAYLVGLVFYANRLPEKQFPGVFDHWGASHQIWHVAVVAGIYFHAMAMVHFFRERYSFGCSDPVV